jgi:hypothetical protein
MYGLASNPILNKRQENEPQSHQGHEESTKKNSNGLVFAWCSLCLGGGNLALALPD